MAYRCLEPSDEIIAVLVLLETRKGHLGAGNILADDSMMLVEPREERVTYLFRVLEILKQRVFVPYDTLVDVGSGILVAFYLSSLTTE